MSSRVRIVEAELGVKVPPQYAAFLDTYGIFYAPGISVYGINDTLLGYDGIPCVIGATQMLRSKEDLPHCFLYVHHTGIEDEIICLDTEDEKVYSFSLEFGNHKVADSFDEWFEKDIIGYLKWMEQYHKEHGDDSEEIIDLDWMKAYRDDM